MMVYIAELKQPFNICGVQYHAWGGAVQSPPEPIRLQLSCEVYNYCILRSMYVQHGGVPQANVLSEVDCKLILLLTLRGNY